MNALKQKLLIIIPILLSVSLILTSVFIIIEKKTESKSNETIASISEVVSSELIENNEFIPQFGSYVKDIPNSIRAAKIIPEIDFLISGESISDTKTKLDEIIKNLSDCRFNTINVVANTENIAIFDADGFANESDDLLQYIYKTAHTLNMHVMVTVDLGALAVNSVINDYDVENIAEILKSDSLILYSDMIVFDNYYVVSKDNRSIAKLSETIKNYCISIVRNDSSIYIGVAAEGFFEPTEENSKDYNYVIEGSADLKLWTSNNYIDFIYVSLPYSIDDKQLNFKKGIELWDKEFSEITDLYFEINYSKYGSDKNWSKPDVIVEQLITLNKKHGLNFGFDSFQKFVNDATECRPAVLKYLKGEMVGNYILKDLSISAPEKLKFTTYQNHVAILGASDPEFSLTLNGQVVERNDLGYFSLDLDLEVGLNTFKITHKGVTKTFKITYKKVVIKEITPDTAVKLDGGSTLAVSTVALSGSTVTATLNDTELTLSEDPIYDELGQRTEYSNYNGMFVMPIVYDEDKNIGNVSFKAVSEYGTETKTGGKVTIIKSERPVVEPDPNPEPAPLPEGGDYVDVGNKLIAEVVADQAETFNINDYDRSRPTNNYLPKGTVDYCSETTTKYGKSTLRTLRFGRTVYNTHNGDSPIKTYEGTLPDHNEVSLVSIDNGGKYTTLTLDVLWKAPFLFDLLEQKYKRNKLYDSNRDFTLNAVTFSYIDITFTYCTITEGDVIFENNPLFSSGEWIKNEGDYTLRLYLNNVGDFYGWKAEYNNDGQLVFSFLNPAKISEDSTNKYGYSLNGVTIVIDPGHGGKDPGSLGFIKDKIEINGEMIQVNENYLNMLLANKLKSELESMGATVYMTRYDYSTTLDETERMAIARSYNPDFIVSIHRNASSESTTPNGFNTYNFNAYSWNAANLMYDATAKENLYPVSKWSGVKSHIFFMSRISDCPVVLTENGFMTNKQNFEKIILDEFNQKCAVALAQGVLDYFKSIQ